MSFLLVGSFIFRFRYATAPENIFFRSPNVCLCLFVSVSVCVGEGGG